MAADPACSNITGTSMEMPPPWTALSRSEKSKSTVSTVHAVKHQVHGHQLSGIG